MNASRIRTVAAATVRTWLTAIAANAMTAMEVHSVKHYLLTPVYFGRLVTYTTVCVTLWAKIGRTGLMPVMYVARKTQHWRWSSQKVQSNSFQASWTHRRREHAYMYMFRVQLVHVSCPTCTMFRFFLVNVSCPACDCFVSSLYILKIICMSYMYCCYSFVLLAFTYKDNNTYNDVRQSTCTCTNKNV